MNNPTTLEGHNTLHQCGHCNGSGTCATGPGGTSCMVCVSRNELNKRKVYTGLACGACGGVGKTDTITYRMQHRMQPLLSISLVLISTILIIFFGLTKSPYCHEILTFCTTILGSVVGYYFSKSEIKN